MIKVSDLAKSYGNIEALRGISFEVGTGEIVGLLGPNGAGKSTTIKILTAYLQPDRGEVIIDGLDVFRHTREVQSRIGYLPENTPLYMDLSVQSYLKWVADIRDIPHSEQRKRIAEAVYATDLQNYLTRQISQLSKGLRQRVGLAQAILHKPRLLILDEPTIGLDPTQIVEIRHLIKRLSGESTILFSSHILSEVEAVCDRVIIIMNGLIRADARLEELATSNTTILVLQNEAPDVNEKLSKLDSVTEIAFYQTANGYPAYKIASDNDISPAIYDVARQQNWQLRELRHDTQTLESVFNRLATPATA